MPLRGQIHRDRPLENISIAYKNDSFIAGQLFPVVPVAKESDTYYVYSRDTMSLPQTLRANGAASNEADWNVSTSSYRLEEHALKQLVTYRDRENADAAIRLDADVTEILTEKIMIRMEVDAAALVMTSTTWANSTSLTTTLAWNTNTTNVITQMDSAASVIVQNSGKKPNVVVLNDAVFRTAKENSATVDRVKYTSSDSIAPSVLAKLWGVSDVLVGSAVRNTAKEGLADSMGFIFPDSVFIGYVERSPSLRKPSALYRFAKSGADRVVRKWPDEERGGDFVEVSTMYSLNAPATACGYLIEDAIQ